jgi:hypothetical protein
VDRIMTWVSEKLNKQRLRVARPRRASIGEGRRALNVQGILWATRQMRSVPLLDLLIGAVAERNRVTIVHYDAGHDTIAEITGQPTQWGGGTGLDCLSHGQFDRFDRLRDGPPAP